MVAPRPPWWSHPSSARLDIISGHADVSVCQSLNPNLSATFLHEVAHGASLRQGRCLTKNECFVT
jgi:hypothetical protein